MSETYKKVFPGNWVNNIDAYPLPNASFKTNNRPPGDPHDRQQQAVLFRPGWMAVRKVAVAKVTDGVATVLPLTILSPDERSDDQPRRNINGLLVPQGALLFRAGLRATSVSQQPGYYSSGDPGNNNGNGGVVDSGVNGTPGDQVVLSSATPAAKNAGVISATACNTPTDPANGSGLVVGADGNLPAGSTLVQAAYGSPVAVTSDLLFQVYSVAASGAAAGSGISTPLLGGVYLVAEVCYLVQEPVVDLTANVFLPGATVAGSSG
jgi:hypothetical protein